MNWEVLLAAVIVAAAILGATSKIRRTQHLALAEARRNAIANMAALFLAARLTDKEYVDQIDKLPTTVKHGLEFYPGSPELLKDAEGEVEAAKEILREIDYAEDEVRKRWIDLASRMYQEFPDFSE
jgi:hypothetical protein